jgi:hypothetical protein
LEESSEPESQLYLDFLKVFLQVITCWKFLRLASARYFQRLVCPRIMLSILTSVADMLVFTVMPVSWKNSAPIPNRGERLSI